MTQYLIPRLTRIQAEKRLRELEAQVRRGGDVALMVDCDPLEAVPNTVGGQAATPAEIQRWRDEVRARVIWTASGKDANDVHSQQLGRAICEVIDPVPGDAGHDGVWAFLSLYVFPDIVAERWPAQGTGDELALNPSRWVGGLMARDRNYLKLAWQRWAILGDVISEAAPPLGEDEFGNLLERTAVARNRRLIRTAAREIVEHDQTTMPRMTFTRELMKLVCYQTGARALDVLTDQELADLVSRQAAAVRTAAASRREEMGAPTDGDPEAHVVDDHAGPSLEDTEASRPASRLRRTVGAIKAVTGR